MEIKQNLFYSKNDEWVEVDGTQATIGITDYAQDALSDIVFLEIIVSVGEEIAAEDNIGTVESVKAASDLYSPVSGKVEAVNQAVIDDPEEINGDPFGKAWMIKLSSPNGFDTSHLMNAKAYQTYCEERD